MRRRHRGPRISISTGGRHTHGGRHYSSRSMRRGILGIIISALFFKGISNLANSNPSEAQNSCRKINSIGTIVALVGTALTFGGMLIFMSSDSAPMYAIVMLVAGVIVAFFGASMKSEANRVGYECAQSNMNGEQSNMNGAGYNTSESSTKDCAYCGTSNPPSNSNCSSCGAGF